MKKTFSSKKSAFSLIELSIVLIIIGLLIAGITGGASLIRSSELRSVMGEARGYAVAVNAFYTQFNALPGDYNVAVGTASAGDNSATIDYFNSASNAVNASESANAWIALRTIGAVDYINSTTTAVSAGATNPVFGTTSSATAPASKIKTAGWVFDYRRQVEGVAAVAANQNTVILTNPITVLATANAITPQGYSGVSNTVAALSGADILSIDTKIDDGIANAGKVRGINPAVTNTSTSGTCFVYSGSAAATYIATSTSAAKVCALSYQVDVNS